MWCEVRPKYPIWSPDSLHKALLPHSETFKQPMPVFQQGLALTEAELSWRGLTRSLLILFKNQNFPSTVNAYLMPMNTAPYYLSGCLLCRLFLPFSFSLKICVTHNIICKYKRMTLPIYRDRNNEAIRWTWIGINSHFLNNIYWYIIHIQ